jgi:serine/threonine protein kinase
MPLLIPTMLPSVQSLHQEYHYRRELHEDKDCCEEDVCGSPPPVATLATDFLADFSLEGSVGIETGVTGTVRTCKRRSDGLEFAFKQLSHNPETARELAIWGACLPHPNILDVEAIYDNTLDPSHPLHPAFSVCDSTTTATPPTATVTLHAHIMPPTQNQLDSQNPQQSQQQSQQQQQQQQHGHQYHHQQQQQHHHHHHHQQPHQQLIDELNCGALEPAHQRFFIVVMPRMETDLFAMAAARQSHKAFTDAELRRILSQVVAGIGHIHARGFVHGDIKLENILVQSIATLQVKICDFGFARPAHELPVRRQFTRAYVSPEAIDSYDMFTRNGAFRPLGPSIDMWALGVVTYTLVFLCLPFAPRSDERGANDNRTITPSLRYQIQGGLYPRRRHETLSPKVLSLIEMCLEPSPVHRAPASVLALHPYISV